MGEECADSGRGAGDTVRQLRRALRIWFHSLGSPSTVAPYSYGSKGEGKGKGWEGPAAMAQARSRAPRPRPCPLRTPRRREWRTQEE